MNASPTEQAPEEERPPVRVFFDEDEDDPRDFAPDTMCFVDEDAGDRVEVTSIEVRDEGRARHARYIGGSGQEASSLLHRLDELTVSTGNVLVEAVPGVYLRGGIEPWRCAAARWHHLAKASIERGNVALRELHLLRTEHQWYLAREDRRRRYDDPRDYGISSDAMVRYALGRDDFPKERPGDLGDLRACYEAFVRAPPHLHARMIEVLPVYARHVADYLKGKAARLHDPAILEQATIAERAATEGPLAFPPRP